MCCALQCYSGMQHNLSYSHCCTAHPVNCEFTQGNAQVSFLQNSYGLAECSAKQSGLGPAQQLFVLAEVAASLSFQEYSRSLERCSSGHLSSALFCGKAVARDNLIFILKFILLLKELQRTRGLVLQRTRIILGFSTQSSSLQCLWSKYPDRLTTPVIFLTLFMGLICSSTELVPFNACHNACPSLLVLPKRCC